MLAKHVGGSDGFFKKSGVETHLEFVVRESMPYILRQTSFVNILINGSLIAIEKRSKINVRCYRKFNIYLLPNKYILNSESFVPLAL